MMLGKELSQSLCVLPGKRGRSEKAECQGADRMVSAGSLTIFIFSTFISEPSVWTPSI